MLYTFLDEPLYISDRRLFYVQTYFARLKASLLRKSLNSIHCSVC